MYGYGRRLERWRQLPSQRLGSLGEQMTVKSSGHYRREMFVHSGKSTG